jgi:sulfur carrier protein ThiS
MLIGYFMSIAEKDEQNFFEKFGLEVTTGEVEVGKTYPIYGMITKFLDNEPESVIVELNFNIVAKMKVPDGDKIELLKERAFEPGIFVGKVIDNTDQILIECSTVIFGRKKHFEV